MLTLLKIGLQNFAYVSLVAPAQKPNHARAGIVHAWRERRISKW